MSVSRAITQQVRCGDISQAIETITRLDLVPTGTTAIQVVPPETTEDVHQLLQAGFRPRRYTHKGHEPGAGSLYLPIGSAEVFASCHGDLLTHAEKRAATAVH